MEREEFAGFYAASFQRLVGQLYSMTGDQAEAQDAVQEAFVRAWARRGRIARDGAPEAWARVTAWRIAASRWRRARDGTRLESLAARPESMAGPTPDRVAFTDALRKLPADQRRAPPAADEIIARGDRRRRHSMTAQSLGALSAAGVVGAGVALGLALTGGAAPARSHSAITTTAFTLVKNANGTTTLTINNNVIFQPAVLQSDLEQDGIPAIVTEGSLCSSSPAPAVTGQFISVQPGPAGETPTVTINPSAMPAGTELSFGNFDLPNSGRTLIGLVDKGSYTCSSTPPASLRGLAVFAFQRKPPQ